MSESDYSTASNAVTRNQFFTPSPSPYNVNNTLYNAPQQQQQQQRITSNVQQQQRFNIPPYSNANQSNLHQLKQPSNTTNNRGVNTLTQQLNNVSINNGYNNQYSNYSSQQPLSVPTDTLSLGGKQSSQTSQSSLSAPLNFASVAAGLNQSINVQQELPRVFDANEFPALSTDISGTSNPIDIDKALQPNASQTTSVIQDDFPVLNNTSNNSMSSSQTDNELRKVKFISCCFLSAISKYTIVISTLTGW